AAPSPRVPPGTNRLLPAGELALEPGAGVRPVAFHGPHRDPKMFSNFGARHSGEEAKHYDLRCARIDRLETCQGGFEREEIFDRHSGRRPCFQQIVHRDRLSAAASLVSLLAPAIVNEQSAHRLRPQRQSMRSSLPLGAALVLKPEAGW